MIHYSKDRVVAESAVAFVYDQLPSIDYMRWLQLRIDEINEQFGELDSEYHSFVVETIIDDERSIRTYIDRDMKGDFKVIDALMRILETPRHHSDPYPTTFKIKKNWQIFPANEKKEAISKISRKDKSEFPAVSIADVPPEFRFMTTSGFKDQASEFYNALSLIYPTSDGAWIQKSYVDRMSARWSHIARADEAFGGLITKMMTKVANDRENITGGWKGFSVSLTRGDPMRAKETLERDLGIIIN